MKREEVITVLGFLLFVQGYLLENVFSALLGFSLMLYLVFLRNGFTPDIDVKWFINRVLVEGEKNLSRIVLKNRSTTELRVLLSGDFLPPNFKSEVKTVTLRGGEELSVDFTVIPPKGKYTISGPEVTVHDMRGLYQDSFTDDSEIEIEVVPSLSKLKDEMTTYRNVKIASNYFKFLAGPHTVELHSLKRFQPGDDTKYIEWKATARLGELIVKDFLKEIEGDICIILDAGREMRKGLRMSKIDYAATLAFYISSILLPRHRVALIIYDDYRVVQKIDPSKSPDHIHKIKKSLAISPLKTEVLGLKIPEVKIKISREGVEFVKRIAPFLRGKKGASGGLTEVTGIIPDMATLIFIADVTSQTSELIRVVAELKQKHRIILLTPNPVLFYDLAKLDRNTLLRIYRRYIEREEMIKKFNRIVPTLDLGPSDFSEVIQGALS